MTKKLFTIQDSNGRYVGKHSIKQNPETKEWYYASRGGYEFDTSMKNMDTGVTLCGSVEEAEGVIEMLKANLHRVNNLSQLEFSIKEAV